MKRKTHSHDYNKTPKDDERERKERERRKKLSDASVTLVRFSLRSRCNLSDLRDVIRLDARY